MPVHGDIKDETETMYKLYYAFKKDGITPLKKPKWSKMCKKHDRRFMQCTSCRGEKAPIKKCKHGKRTTRCGICNPDGKGICDCGKRTDQCALCEPVLWDVHLRRCRRRTACANNFSGSSSIGDLGCSKDMWREWLLFTLKKNYNKEASDLVNEKGKRLYSIDEIIPVKAWNLPEDNKYCWHFLNSQYLLCEDNSSKSSKFNDENKENMKKIIDSYQENPLSLEELKNLIQ